MYSLSIALETDSSLIDVDGTRMRVAPQLRQKATGKQWYKAFQGVGFNYGPSFQGVDCIMSDPTTMDATANVPIRTESGIMKGESHYALHPSSIDNCLQLALISISCGVVRNMNSGYVPVKAREITIRLPKTESLGLEVPGKAYAKTTGRGVRSATCFVQLTAGNEVLLDIDDLRVISYNAAVPQKLDVTINQSYWESRWVPAGSSTEGKLQHEIDKESQMVGVKNLLVVSLNRVVA